MTRTVQIACIALFVSLLGALIAPYVMRGNPRVGALIEIGFIASMAVATGTFAVARFRPGGITRVPLKWVAFGIAVIACALLGRRAWVVDHTWMLLIFEPTEHGGYGVPFHSQAACNHALQENGAEVARFEAQGLGEIAPIAIVRCSHPRFW